MNIYLSPRDLGTIDAWLESQQGVRQLASHRLQINRQRLPSEPQVLASGSSARVLEVELVSGERVIIPRANVELIEG